MATDPVLYMELRGLWAWLSETLPCSMAVDVSGDRRCVQGGAHARPCPLWRFAGITPPDPDRDRAAMLSTGCALIRLCRYVRCLHDGPHFDGCRAMTRAHYTYDLDERFGIRTTKHTHVRGYRPVDGRSGDEEGMRYTPQPGDAP